VAALWSSISGAVLDYLRPNMRGWVAVGGVLLIVFGAAGLWAARADHPAKGHAITRVGWLIALPICVGVTVGSGSLGVYSVGRNATYRDLPDAPRSFDLEQYVRAQSFGGQPVELTLVDLLSAASTDEGRAILAEHPLASVGFLSRRDDGTVSLTRYVISCCAADATVVQLDLASADPLPPDGTWVRVVGSLDERAGDTPRLVVAEHAEVPEPEHPYEVPISRIR
jgi:uncharacterized repeat protein (TIGR03943 family)